MPTFTEEQYGDILINVAGVAYTTATSMSTYQVELGKAFVGKAFVARKSYHYPTSYTIEYSLKPMGDWRLQAICDMANELNRASCAKRQNAIDQTLADAKKKLPSHAKMARIRSSRTLRHQTKLDNLAFRESGWVLHRQIKKRERLAREAAQRIHKKMERSFLPYYEQADFRQAKESAWVDGTGHITRVVITKGAPGVVSTATKVWHAHKCRSGVLSQHTFHLQPNWQRMVGSRGIAAIDGMLTLFAVAIPRQHRKGLSEAYRATWARQGKGTLLVQEHGIIGRLSPNHPWIHGKTVAQVTKTAKRQVCVSGREKAIVQGDWDKVWPRKDLSTIMVCLDDSKNAGNCTTGTHGWVARWLPDYVGLECAPASVVLSAVSKDNTSTRRRAVAAVHRAILRQRRA